MKTGADKKASFRRTTGHSVEVRLPDICWISFAPRFAPNAVCETCAGLGLGNRSSIDDSENKGPLPAGFEVPGGCVLTNDTLDATVMAVIPCALPRPVTGKIVQRVQRYQLGHPSDKTAECDTVCPILRKYLGRARASGLDFKIGLAAVIIQALVMTPILALKVKVMFFILHAVMKSGSASALFTLPYAFASPIYYRTAQLDLDFLVVHSVRFAFTLYWKTWGRSCSQKRMWSFTLRLFLLLSVIDIARSIGEFPSDETGRSRHRITTTVCKLKRCEQPDS